MTAAELAQALGPYTQHGDTFTVSCPAHDDHDPSLDITEKNGKTVVICRAGCTQESVLSALRERNISLGKRNTNTPIKQKVVAKFSFVDESGVVAYEKERLEPGKKGRKKDFRFSHINPSTGKREYKRGSHRSVLYNLDKIGSASTVHKFEGEAKADIATNMFGVIGTTLDTGAQSELSPSMKSALDALAGKDVVLHPDNQDIGRTFMNVVAAYLFGKAKSIKIATLPGLPEKGDIVDWVKVPGNDKAAFFDCVAAAVEWEPPQADDDLPDYVTEINTEYFVVRDGSKTVVCRQVVNPITGRAELTRSSFNDFRNYFSNRRVEIGTDSNGNPRYKPMGSEWLNHPQRRQYSDVVMAPNRDVPGCYNLWRGFSVQPIKGSWRLMREHIYVVICDSDDMVYQYVMGWLARMIQYPELPGEVALVLKGGRGTGKGFFGNALCTIMGQHSCHVTNGKHVSGNFNAHLEDCIFLFADEAFWAGDKQGENVLKGLITEPTIPIERKGVDLKTVPNMLHVLMASNNDWVVPAGVDERRYAVMNVSDCHVQDHKYFAALDHELKHGGLEAMLYELQTMDISAFNVRAVPETSGLLEQKIQSLDPAMNWWFQKLQEGELLPGQDWGRVPFPALYDDFVISVQKLGIHARRSTETSFAMQLRKALPPGWPKENRAVPDNAPYGFSTKRVKHYTFPALEVCRNSFDKMLGSRMEWPETSHL